MANPPAVTPGGSDITLRTPSTPPSDGRDRPAPVMVLGTQELEAGCERPFGIFHHAISPSLHPSRQARPRSHELRQIQLRSARQQLMSDQQHDPVVLHASVELSRSTWLVTSLMGDNLRKIGMTLDAAVVFATEYLGVSYGLS
jgi:hypothetical protein